MRFQHNIPLPNRHCPTAIENCSSDPHYYLISMSPSCRWTILFNRQTPTRLHAHPNVSLCDVSVNNDLWRFYPLRVQSHFGGKRQISDAFYIQTFQSEPDPSLISDILDWQCNLWAASTNCFTGDRQENLLRQIKPNGGTVRVSRHCATST